jgi:hypothetical protein
MAYIFMDESGNLGFDFSKKKTSKYFVISFLFVKSEKDKKTISKIVKKIFSGFTKNELKHHTGSLHCYKEKPKTRLKLLALLKEKDISIINIYLNKKKVYTRLHDEKQILYNYVTNILLDRIFTKKLIPLDEKIYLIASRRETNRFLNENFKGYLRTQVKNNHQADIEIIIKPPNEEKCLQVVDFVSWAIFRKYEYDDESYMRILKDRIIENNPLFS